MDQKLVGWARAVKVRFRGAGLPPLWLFTDQRSMPDLIAVVTALPRGLCGVVFRHDGVAGRAMLAKQVAAVCRRRRLAMVVAGHAPCLPGVGRHLRERGGLPHRNRGHLVWTASAHGLAGLVRARRARVGATFLSPVFATASHPERAGLGVTRWAALARRNHAVFALGGIDGASVRRLPRWVRGVGAIGAFLG